MSTLFHPARILWVILCTCVLAACGNPNATEETADPMDVATSPPATETIEDEPAVAVHPIYHGSVVLTAGERTLFVDPFGGADRYAKFSAPDMVFITHTHSDHLNPETLRGLDLSGATLIAPQSVVDKLGTITFETVKVMANGDELALGDVDVEAVAMYNLPEDPESFHPKGKFNGYVISVGGRRYYFSGDTEDIEEMRNLEDIDVAFVCMNLPYTMTPEAAADAVLDFKPEVVYPYHYRNGDGSKSDVEAFKTAVNAGDKSIDVRLEDWYTEASTK